AGDPFVLEFNCRLGDPETQPLMMRLQSDLVDLALSAIHHKLHETSVQWDPRPALGVVLAAKGYPGEVELGTAIPGLPSKETRDQKCFHAGTRLEDKKIVTAGGRVLCATALGDTISAAQQNAYSLCKQIAWPDAIYRRDIGYRAVKRGL
nr:phosphoribosylamine--glycine ligase [Pseudomonadota bacterium]